MNRVAIISSLVLTLSVSVAKAAKIQNVYYGGSVSELVTLNSRGDVLHNGPAKFGLGVTEDFSKRITYKGDAEEMYFNVDDKTGPVRQVEVTMFYGGKADEVDSTVSAVMSFENPNGTYFAVRANCDIWNAEMVCNGPTEHGTEYQLVVYAMK